LSEAASAKDHNHPQTPPRPRNEGVRGSSPRVGFAHVTGDETLVNGYLVAIGSTETPFRTESSTFSEPLAYLSRTPD